MKNMAKVISDLVAINHSYATFDSDIFNIEIHEDKLHISPRISGNGVFYRIAQVSKVLNNHNCTWYMRREDDGSMRVTAW
jgi:hypothetical protein